MDREYIGIDLHKAFFQACAVTPSGERRWERRFPRTTDGIAQFVARGVGPQQAIAVEASGPTWAFVDALAPTGATVCVVDPRKTKLKAGFAAKTDRLDAWRLADALRRESVVSTYIPPPAGVARDVPAELLRSEANALDALIARSARRWAALRAAWIERRAVHKCRRIPSALVKPRVARSMLPAVGRRPTAGRGTLALCEPCVK